MKVKSVVSGSMVRIGWDQLATPGQKEKSFLDAAAAGASTPLKEVVEPMANVEGALLSDKLAS